MNTVDASGIPTAYYDTALFVVKRGFFASAARAAPDALTEPLIATLTEEEQHHDELMITEHPVEQGAPITDHAFKQAAQVQLRLGWSASDPEGETNPTYLNDLYTRLLSLQVARIPFDVFTGKRYYQNMLIKSLVTVTDKKTAQVLNVVLGLQEVIIVQTEAVTVPTDPDVQEFAERTAGVTNAGTLQAIELTVESAQATLDVLEPLDAVPE